MALCLVAACASVPPAAPAVPDRTKGGFVALPGIDPARVEEAAAARKIALIVGVDNFEDPFWPPLKYPTRDADALATALSDEFDEVVVLSGKPTRRAQLLDAVRALAERAPRARDTVVLYVSGHGTLAVDPRGEPRRVLVMSDTRQRDLLGTGVSVRELIGMFDRLPSQKKALILATCYSGAGKSMLRPEIARRFEGLKGAAPNLIDASRASIVVSAADFGQPAREDDRLKHDVYTYFFLEALRERADGDGDGAISITEAHDYARQHTFDFTEGRQLATVESRIAGVDPIFIAGKADRPALPVLYGYSGQLAGVRVQVAGRTKGVLPGHVVLEPGASPIALELANGEVLFTDTVSLSAGDRISVQSLLQPEQKGWALLGRAGALNFVGPKQHLSGVLGSVGLLLRGRDVPWSWIDWIVDASAAQSDQQVTVEDSAVQQDVSVFQIGAGLAFATDFGPVRVFAGPHGGYVIVRRGVDLPGLAERQTVGAPMVGGLMGVSFDLGAFTAMLEGRGHYLRLNLADGAANTAAIGAFGGVGYVF